MDEIISALGCIPVKDCSYAEWLGIGMALKDAGYECDVWDDWSKNDKRYVEGDCARRWATFKGSERPVTVRTIRSSPKSNRADTKIVFPQHFISKSGRKQTASSFS